MLVSLFQDIPTWRKVALLIFTLNVVMAALIIDRSPWYFGVAVLLLAVSLWETWRTMKRQEKTSHTKMQD